MTTVYEHRVVRFELGWRGFDHEEVERQLDDLGRQGWQAVSSLQPSIGGASSDILVILTRAR